MSIKIKQTVWNFKPLFKSDNDSAMAEARKKVESESYKFINKWRGRTDYLENPAVMKEALDEYEAWRKYFYSGGGEETYFQLRTYQDQNSPKLKAKYNKIKNLSVKIANDIQFFLSKISRIDKESQKKFLEFEGLKDYKHWLEKTFAEAKHLLTEPEEKIMNLKASPAYSNWVNMTEDFLSKEEREVLGNDGKKAKKNFSEILNLSSSKKKRVRDMAAAAMNDIFRKHSDAAEAEMNSIMADKKINDELRGFARPDALMHLKDDIASEVADALVDAASSRFDVSRRYYRLKAKLFGVKKLKHYERSVEYGNLNKSYSYQEAVNIVFNAFDKTDKEFANIFRKFIDNGQIDAFPKKGKNSGGMCFKNLISHPTYISINFTGRLRDVFTLAHESGHGINNEFMRKKLNSLNFGGPRFTAEIASKFAEELIFHEMIKIKNNELRLAMLIVKLNNEIFNVFAMTVFNKFEREMHQAFRQKGYLSKEEIGQLWKKHMASFFGSAVEQTEGSENWWMPIRSFRVFFYNYQYSSGVLIAKALHNYFREKPLFMEEIKEILSAGSSDSPVNIFLKAGIDISDKKFWNKGIEGVEGLLDETEALAKKLGKI